jgi:hypothetical protein
MVSVVKSGNAGLPFSNGVFEHRLSSAIVALPHYTSSIGS